MNSGIEIRDGNDSMVMTKSGTERIIILLLIWLFVDRK